MPPAVDGLGNDEMSLHQVESALDDSASSRAVHPRAGVQRIGVDADEAGVLHAGEHGAKLVLGDLGPVDAVLQVEEELPEEAVRLGEVLARRERGRAVSISSADCAGCADSAAPRVCAVSAASKPACGTSTLRNAASSSSYEVGMNSLAARPGPCIVAVRLLADANSSDSSDDFNSTDFF